MSTSACAHPDELVDTRFSLQRRGARAVYLAFFLTRAEDAPDPDAGFPLPGCYDGNQPAIVSDLQQMTSTRSGQWHVVVSLRPGWHKYAFLVDGSWVQDPEASHVCSDGDGGRVSVRNITRPVEAIRFPVPTHSARRHFSPLRRAV
ncbi:MAG TPA: glycogen-binding domain-containing protein [Candidatus Didemnitutus sp.]|nr:glycogen-binding domain-containing protein [Candidatus Didemnitutus sp.]